MSQQNKYIFMNNNQIDHAQISRRLNIKILFDYYDEFINYYIGQDHSYNGIRVHKHFEGKMEWTHDIMVMISQLYEL